MTEENITRGTIAEWVERAIKTADWRAPLDTARLQEHMTDSIWESYRGVSDPPPDPTLPYEPQPKDDGEDSPAPEGLGDAPRPTGNDPIPDTDTEPL